MNSSRRRKKYREVWNLKLADATQTVINIWLGEMEWTSTPSVFCPHEFHTLCARLHTFVNDGIDREQYKNWKSEKYMSSSYVRVAEEFPLRFLRFRFSCFYIYISFFFSFYFLLLFRIDIFHALTARPMPAHRSATHKVPRAVTHAASGERQSV